MHTFFHGWRRKAGCVALVMACVFTGIWIRSYRIVDTFSFHPDNGPRHYLTLSPYGAQWARKEGSGQVIHGPTFMSFGWDSTDFTDEEFGDPTYGWDAVQNWKCCGFQFSLFQLSGKS